MWHHHYSNMFPICSGTPQDNRGVWASGKQTGRLTSSLTGKKIILRRKKKRQFCTVSLGVAGTVMSTNKFLFFVFFKVKFVLVETISQRKSEVILEANMKWLCGGLQWVPVQMSRWVTAKRPHLQEGLQGLVDIGVVKVIPSFLSLHFEITIISLALWCSFLFVSLTPLLSNAGSLKLAWGNGVDTAVKLNHEVSQSPLASQSPTWGPFRKKDFAFWQMKKAEELWAAPLFFFPPFICQSRGYKTVPASESL